jgi:hypothetical protein
MAPSLATEKLGCLEFRVVVPNPIGPPPHDQGAQAKGKLMEAKLLARGRVEKIFLMTKNRI